MYSRRCRQFFEWFFSAAGKFFTIFRFWPFGPHCSVNFQYFPPHLGLFNFSKQIFRYASLAGEGRFGLLGAEGRGARAPSAPSIIRPWTVLSVQWLRVETSSNFFSAMSDSQHDYAKFGTGSKKTLLDDAKAKGMEPRTELLKFHEQFYSSDMWEQLHIIQFTVTPFSFASVAVCSYYILRNSGTMPLLIQPLQTLCHYYFNRPMSFFTTKPGQYRTVYRI